MKQKITLPGDTDRLSIVGATGSGKTQAALWHLSRKNFNVKPWIIYDFKNDDLIGELEFVNHISLDTPLPERAGIYIAHPNPGQEIEVEDHMWKVWAQGNMGVFVDEGYLVGNNNRAFRALLTQGRSKHIPMIILAQRPVWLDRFVFSESSHFQIFRLQHRKDLASVNEFIPFALTKRLPDFHSYYYDVGNDTLVTMSPVPDIADIIETFDEKLIELKKVV